MTEETSFKIEDFVQNLLDKGYQTFRRTFDKKKGFELVPYKWNNIYVASNFNYMVSGGCDVRFIKDGHEVIIGLGNGKIAVF
jgi:hypothetical protein